MATFLRSATAVYDLGAEFNQPTINSVQCAVGDYLVAIYQYRNTSGNQTSSPTWNGETLPQIFSDYLYVASDQFAKISIYAKFVASAGTFNVIGNANNFIACECTALVFSGVNTSAPLSTLFSVNKFETASYANPALAVTGAASTDVIIDILGSSFWDANYSTLPATTWTASQGQTNVSDLVTTSNQIGRQKVGRKTGTGTVNVGYAPSAGQPGYGYLAFVLKNSGAAVSLDTVTTGGVSGVKAGSNLAFTATGLTGAVTSINIQTTATPTAQTNSTAITGTATSGGATVPGLVDNTYLPFQGPVVVTVTATGGAPTKTVNFSIPDGFLDTKFLSVNLQDNTWLGFALSAIGHPLQVNEFCYYQMVNSLSIGNDGKITVMSATTTTIYIHKLDGKIEGYDVNITESGAITGIARITSKAITSKNLTSKNITQRA